MEQPLIDALTKKHDDINEIIITETEIIVNTSNDQIEQEQEQNSNNELNQPLKSYSVPLQIVRNMFMIKAALWFCLGVFGIVPAQLVTLPQVALALFISSIVTLTILLIAMYLVKKYKDLLLTFLLLGSLCLYTVIFASASYFQDIAPFQACTILFIQCISVLVYGLFVSKHVDGLWVGLIMILVGVTIWAVGLVAFIKQQDWIMSGILFFSCVIFFPVYSGWFVTHLDKRFHINELEQVIVAFFTDFFIIPIKWIYAKYAGKDQPMSFVLVDSEVTVPQNA